MYDLDIKTSFREKAIALWQRTTPTIGNPSEINAKDSGKLDEIKCVYLLLHCPRHFIWR